MWDVLAAPEAQGFARLFCSGQYGRLLICVGSQEQGNVFKIYVLPEGVLVSDGVPPTEAVCVYGVIGGFPERTETYSYGWLHKGKWQTDFYTLVEQQRTERASSMTTSAQAFVAMQEKAIANVQLLSTYE